MAPCWNRTANIWKVRWVGEVLGGKSTKIIPYVPMKRFRFIKIRPDVGFRIRKLGKK